MTATATAFDVAIVGGGLVGATLALMLRQAAPHLCVGLVEAQPLSAGGEQLPSFDERTSAISPTSQEAFVKLGLWSALGRYASPIDHIQVTDRGYLGALRLGPQDNNGNPLGYVVKNRGFGEVLTQALAQSDIQVLAPESVARVQPVRGCASVQLQSGTSLNARLLVIADGLDSPLRQQLGIAEDVHDYNQYAVVSSVRYSKPHNATAYERFTAEGPMALLPLTDCHGQASGVVWTFASEQLEQVKGWSDQDFLQHLQQLFGYGLGEFVQLGPRAYYPLSLRIAKEQVRSNIVLMGNAAHFLHPVAGQGFNLAMRDMLRLVDIVKNVPPERIGDLATLNIYLEQQDADQAHTVFLSHNFNQWFKQNRFGVPHLRSLGFLLLETLPVLKHELILQMSGRASAKAQPWG